MLFFNHNNETVNGRHRLKEKKSLENHEVGPEKKINEYKNIPHAMKNERNECLHK